MTDALLSTVIVVHNDADRLNDLVARLSALLSGLVSDYELVIVDNGSTDGSLDILEDIVAEHANVQVYSLSRTHDKDIAVIAGLENAIGDYVVVLEPFVDDVDTIPLLLQAALEGHDIVLAVGAESRYEGRLYLVLSSIYVRLFRWLTGFDLRRDTPRFRLMSRRVVNYVLQHQAAFLLYQVLPVTAGFRRAIVPTSSASGRGPFVPVRSVRLIESLNRALAMIVSSSLVPMRLASAVCLAAATLSVLYSIYVVLIFALKESVAPGWTTLSLQTSGLFFLLSVAIAVLAEYVIRIADLSTDRPLYYISREFRSEALAREQRLNVIRSSKTKRERAPKSPTPESILRTKGREPNKN